MMLRLSTSEYSGCSVSTELGVSMANSMTPAPASPDAGVSPCAVCGSFELAAAADVAIPCALRAGPFQTAAQISYPRLILAL